MFQDYSVWGIFACLAGSIPAAAVSRTPQPDCTSINAISPLCKTNESAYHRDVFFVGGKYEASGTSYIVSDQIHVEKLTPVFGVTKPYPLVFISAGLPSGSVWLNTPDNRKGWATYMLDKGYQVYILDITGSGRSGQNNVARFALHAGSTTAIHENGFTAPELIDSYPQAQGHDKWPGNGTRGDAVFDAFFAATLPLPSNTTAQELAMRAAGCALLARIGTPAYLVAHSAGATLATLLSDACPAHVRASINLEPGNLPFQGLYGNATVPAGGRTRTRPWGLTNTAITYSPPVADAAVDLRIVEVGVDAPARRSCFLQASSASLVRTLPQIAQVPYVMFTAANSPHITYDHCFVLFL